MQFETKGSSLSTIISVLLVKQTGLKITVVH